MEKSTQYDPDHDRTDEEYSSDDDEEGPAESEIFESKNGTICPGLTHI